MGRVIYFEKFQGQIIFLKNKGIPPQESNGACLSILSWRLLYINIFLYEVHFCYFKSSNIPIWMNVCTFGVLCWKRLWFITSDLHVLCFHLSCIEKSPYECLYVWGFMQGSKAKLKATSRGNRCTKQWDLVLSEKKGSV